MTRKQSNISSDRLVVGGVPRICFTAVRDISSYGSEMAWQSYDSEMNGLLILAGGKATRLKGKCFVEFNGVSMLQRVYNELSGIFPEIVISARNRENEDKIKKLTNNSRIVYDNEKYNLINSPLVGIVSAFSEMKSEIVFVVSCDVPLVKKEIVKMILSESSGFDAVVPKNDEGFIEPLIAAYNRKAMLKTGKAAINSNQLSVRGSLDKLNVNYIPMDKFKEVDPMLLGFRNVNSEKDLNNLMKLEIENIK